MRQKLYEIIFEADTPEGKIFDIGLLIAIIFSVLVVVLESVPSLNMAFGNLWLYIEWFITTIFIIEYVLRIYVVAKPHKYIFSFYGIIDLLAILPMFATLFFIPSQGLSVVRALRLIRVFRIMKLTRYSQAGRELGRALWKSRAKISVFLLFVVTIVLIIGAIMYVVEAGQNGFASIPDSIYWAIVTMTTVGYGDIAPTTAIGKMIASFVMLLGYGIIAVPTGIVSVEIFKSQRNTQVCESCLESDHDDNAIFCKKCGTKL